MITFIYLLLLAVGVVWIVYRAKNYIRSERQREQDLGDMFSEDQFKAYLEVLKKQNAENAGPDSGSKPSSKK